MCPFSVNAYPGALPARQPHGTTQHKFQAQSQVSTVRKVGDTSDIAGLSAVSDSLDFGARIVAAARNAIGQVISILASLQQIVTNAAQTGQDLSTLQKLVAADLARINQFAAQSSVAGVNLLTTQGAGVIETSAILQGLDGSAFTVANQATTVGGGNAITLTDALGLTGLNGIANRTSGNHVSTMQNAVTNANTIAANLGAVSQQITGTQKFLLSLSSALTAGVGALADADLAAERARLASLQVRQLALHSLAIASQPQSLLTLFPQ